jgi:hypothetical protein
MDSRGAIHPEHVCQTIVQNAEPCVTINLRVILYERNHIGNGERDQIVQGTVSRAAGNSDFL